MARSSADFSVALLSAGFKCSRALLDRLGPASGRHQAAGEDALGAVRQLVGDHVQRNLVLHRLPGEGADTVEFWSKSVAQALQDPRSPRIDVARSWSTGS